MKTLIKLVLLSCLFHIQMTFAAPPSRTNIPETPEGILFEKDIPYRKGHARWVLNVIRPKAASTKPRAAIMLIHGGGWTAGDHYRFSYLGFRLARKGYVTILPTYRMIQDAPFPACLHDVKNAIRWVRAHAKTYNIDPDRIGAYGNSAGGTLVLTAAITNKEDGFEGNGPYQEFSSSLQAIVCSGAVGDMRHKNHSKRAATVYRALATGRKRKLPEEEIDKIMAQASPVSYVRKDVPPMILIHGAKDTVVFIDSTDVFVKAMQDAGADITYMRYEDGTHGVMGQKGNETTPAMLKLFEKHLKTTP